MRPWNAGNWMGMYALIALLSVGGTTQAAGASLQVTIEYTGAGEVDEQHKLYVFLYDSPEFGGAEPIGSNVLTENGVTVTFSDLTAPEVYLIALFDQEGGWAGAGSPPIQTPIARYPAGSTTLEPIRPAETAAVTFRFSDARRLIDLATPPEHAEKLEGAQGIVEIRMYKIKPGMRDQFVRFFEDKTLDPQHEVGMRILGQFRSLEDDDTFVWVRAFADQEERNRQTAAFYGGELWRGELSEEAMSMIESTEVLVVEPTRRSKLR